MTTHEKAIEAAAIKMKAIMCTQMDGKPLHGDTNSTDWTAQGGFINFTELAEIALKTYNDTMRELSRKK